MGDSLDHPADLNGILLSDYVIDSLEAECFQCRSLLRNRPDLAANLFDAYLAHCDDSLSSLSVDSSVLASGAESVSSLDFSLSSSVSALAVSASATFSDDS